MQGRTVKILGASVDDDVAADDDKYAHETSQT